MRKLLKYEFRALWRVFVPFWAGILVLGLLNGLSLRPILNNTAAENFSGIILFAYVVAIIAVLVVALVFMINRFYKGLLKGNGYLMFTLPVSTDSLIWSKAISSVLLFLGTGLCCFLSFLFIMQDLSLGELLRIGKGLNTYFNVGGRIILCACAAVCLLIFVAALFAGIFQWYLSMSIGHLANKGRGVLSIAAFMGINMVRSMLGDVLGGLMQLGSGEPARWVMDIAEQFTSMMWGTETQMTAALGMALVALLVILLVQAMEALLYFFFTRLILNRRLNLE